MLRALAAALAAVSLAAPGHREIARTTVIGHSVRGRAIRAIELGDPTLPPTLVVGYIHGNERAGVAIVLQLLAARPRGVHLWLVPTLNPDGGAANTRQNARGVDLNRNWPAEWVAFERPWDPFYSGPRPASEPETRAGLAFISRIKPRLTIWYHQHLDLVWGSGSGATLSAEKRYAALTGMRWERRPSLHGAATRWERARLVGAAAFVVELPAGRLSPAAVRRHAAAVIALSK